MVFFLFNPKYQALDIHKTTYVEVTVKYKVPSHSLSHKEYLESHLKKNVLLSSSNKGYFWKI